MPEAHDVKTYIESTGALHEALGLTSPLPVEVRMLARGEYNQNFVFSHPETGQELLFRVNLGSQMHLENQIEYEAHALELLAPSGRTPRLLYVDGSKSFFGKGILVEEFLSGRPLDYSTDLTLAAQILADIHSVPVAQGHGLVMPRNPLVSMLEECFAMFSQYRRWSNADTGVVCQIESWFKKAEKWAEQWEQNQKLLGLSAPGRHIISTELNSGNFLINEGACSYLIDWEKPLFAEVEQDLAHFLVPTTTYWKTDTILDDAAIDDFIDEYCYAVAGRFETAEVRNHLTGYLATTCLRGITWCAMAFVQHISNEREVADAYTFEKIRLYLSSEFLTLLKDRYYR